MITKVSVTTWCWWLWIVSVDELWEGIAKERQIMWWITQRHFHSLYTFFLDPLRSFTRSLQPLRHEMCQPCLLPPHSAAPSVPRWSGSWGARVSLCHTSREQLRDQGCSAATHAMGGGGGCEVGEGVGEDCGSIWLNRFTANRRLGN